jgi:type IV secretion system protein VirB6
MYESILTTVDAAIATFVIGLFSGLAEEIKSTLRLMMMLSTILYGLSIMQGWIEASIKDAVKHLTLAILVYIFATNLDLFISFFYTIFTVTPSLIIGSVFDSVSAPSGTANSVNGINSFIGNVYDQGIRAAGALMFNSGGFSVGVKLMGFFVAIATIGLCGYAAFLIIMAKIAVAVLLGLSPIFIAMLFFKVTKGIFEGWLRQLINFAIIPLITYTIMFFVLIIIGQPVNDMATAQVAGDISMSDVGPYLLTSVISFLLLLQVFGIASGIAGGVSISTLGVIGSRMNRNILNSLRGKNLKIPGRRNKITN